MEAEDGAAGGVGLQQVREAGFDAGGLIKEGEGSPRGWESLGDAFAVLLGLDFDTDEGRAFLFGLDGAGGLAIDKEEIVGFAVAVRESEFANRNAAAGVDVGVGTVLNEPPSGDKHAIDGLAGLFFRRQSELKALGHPCMTMNWKDRRSEGSNLQNAVESGA